MPGSAVRHKRLPNTRRFARPDFSPLAALGLMLVNFFMVQAVWQKPQVMPLVMPESPMGYWDDEVVKSVRYLTLLCGRDNVYAYTSLTEPVLDSTDYSPAGLRQRILEHKRFIDQRFGQNEYIDSQNGQLKRASFAAIIIKPLPEATFGNIVDVLDEMNICHIRYYLLLDIQPAEIAFVKKPEQGLVLYNLHYPWF